MNDIVHGDLVNVEVYGNLMIGPCGNPRCLGPLCGTGVPDRPARLFFTVGCPRSGKTTLGRRWLHRKADLGGFPDDGFPRYLWDTDNLRLELYDKSWLAAGESMSFAVKRYAVAAALRTGHDVLVAGTHTSKTSIRRLLEVRRDAVPVLVDTPLDVCLERAVATDQSYLLGVIPRTHGQLQALKEEGIDKVVRGILDDIDNRVPY